MIDVVGNHSGPIGYDYGKINPFNKAEHYHDNCSIDPDDFNGGNQWKVEHCRLADLPDLNQDSNQWVRKTLTDWIRDLV
jgi:alpha-amylase